MSGGGLKTDPKKIRAVQNLSRLQSRIVLTSFLGFVQYLGNFIPNMVRKPTETDVEWKWTETEENSFNKLKKLATLTDASVPISTTLHCLSHSPNIGRLRVLVVSSRRKANQKHSSRALTNTQQRYAQIEKDTQQVVFGCERFHCVCVWYKCRTTNRPQAS